LERVTIESRRGRGSERHAALLELERADGELGDPLVHRETLRRRMEYAATIGDLAMQDSAVTALTECVDGGDYSWRAIAQLARAKLHFTRGELAQAYSHAEAALSSSRTAGNESGVVDALCFSAKVEGFRGNLSSAVALYDEAAQVAARAADPVLEMLALGSGWVVAYQHRDFQRCRSLGERCAELAVELGDRPAEAQARSRIGISLLASEAHTAEARLNFAAAARTYEESGDRSGAGAQLMNRAVLEAKLGFFDRASDATERAIALFERAGDERGRVGSLANLIYIKACLQDVKAARTAARNALEDARLHGFGLIEASILENLAFAEATAGNYHRAIELAEESFALRARSQSEVWSSKTLADVGTWYAKVGNFTTAVQTVRRLLSDEEAIARGSDWPAYCYWSAAQVLHAAGDSEAASRALECARRIMQISSDALLDPEDRASFLALPFHCEIARTAATGEWPDLLQRVANR
jgi:tetratricopeptide (TPR) repeat protein